MPSAVLFRELLIWEDVLSAMASRVSGSRESYHMQTGDVPQGSSWWRERSRDLPAVAWGSGKSLPLAEPGRHFSHEPFLDGLASFPKGCFPPSYSAGRQAAE